MRYPASEKLEIIRTVETSPLPVRRTLAQIGIPKSTFYAWLDRHAEGGLDALDDRKPVRSGSGTASRITSASGSSRWLSRSLSYRRVRLLSLSPIASVLMSPRPVFIDCCGLRGF